MTYPGGKGSVYHQIINQIPPHSTYIEAFAGGAAIARRKRPAKLNYLIDLDPQVIDNLDSGDFATASRDDARWNFIQADALAMLSYWLDEGRISPDTFIYLDPPYLASTRRQLRQIYRYEMMTDEQHIELLNLARQLPGQVMISGYWSELYAQALNGCGWRSISFPAMTRGGSQATEWLWMNYDEPSELHDYSYLGDDFRERERIGRKARRWVKNLMKMPELERNAILAAIEEHVR